ncbi:MAG TPA: ABC transporter ATP-binding protein/permease [Rhizobiaceae bacterium]|nr:ABC transporter ATP-binding protein/permease [Rhizobiaceae bacterium]
MQDFWGLMKSYWLSDQWLSAWILTFLIMALTAASSKAGVWMAESSGDLVNAIASFHDQGNHNPLRMLLTSGGTLLGLAIFKDAGLIGIRAYISSTLHRKWRGWLNGRFNEALLDANHTHLHLQHDAGEENGQAPDNVDQRVQESIKSMTGGAIGLAMGIVGVLMSLFFVGQVLIRSSVPVRGMAFLGDYGSAALALGAVAVYVPLNTFIAVKLGGFMERLNVAMQQAEGTYRGELTTLLRRSMQMAASGAEHVQKNLHRRLYDDIDKTWARLNKVNASYQAFQLTYDFMAARIVAYAPGLISYAAGEISLKRYITGSELIASLIGQCSWFIHVMPAIATLKADSQRVTGLARAIEQVQQPQEFYRKTGRSNFRYATQKAKRGLTIRNVELQHQGMNAVPFLMTGDVTFRPGEWTIVRGPSGSGKTSLLKAINGLWAYGSGDIILPEGVAPFYASQEVKLQRLTLKELVCLPAEGAKFTDARVASALHKAGLGAYIENMGEESREGKLWDQILSGGQKQKLVLARIVLHRPQLLFLDEATGALDPVAKVDFHQVIKDNCPDAIVISVMHEIEPPIAATGVEFYDSMLKIAEGMATKLPWDTIWKPSKVAAAPLA